MDNRQAAATRIENAKRLVRELDLEGGLEGGDNQLIAVGDEFCRRQMVEAVAAIEKNLSGSTWQKYTNQYQQQLTRDRLQCLQMVLDNWEAITTGGIK